MNSHTPSDQITTNKSDGNISYYFTSGKLETPMLLAIRSPIDRDIFSPGKVLPYTNIRYCVSNNYFRIYPPYSIALAFSSGVENLWSAVRTTGSTPVSVLRPITARLSPTCPMINFWLLNIEATVAVDPESRQSKVLQLLSQRLTKALCALVNASIICTLEIPYDIYKLLGIYVRIKLLTSWPYYPCPSNTPNITRLPSIIMLKSSWLGVLGDIF